MSSAHWSPRESELLLDLVKKKGNLMELMGSANRQNEDMWRDVGACLCREGFNRTSKQCRSKWKCLKRHFYLEQRRFLNTGWRSSSLPLHYKKILMMWKKAGRPDHPTKAGSQKRKRAMFETPHTSESAVVPAPRKVQRLRPDYNSPARTQNAMKEEQQVVATAMAQNTLYSSAVVGGDPQPGPEDGMLRASSVNTLTAAFGEIPLFPPTPNTWKTEPDTEELDISHQDFFVDRDREVEHFGAPEEEDKLHSDLQTQEHREVQTSPSLLLAGATPAFPPWLLWDLEAGSVTSWRLSRTTETLNERPYTCESLTNFCVRNAHPNALRNE
ncbi:uncharacterized protein LOC102355313 isoform X2 [Latimeria chalumnae]|uniref:uncharacterized protein LOC102355313 isoform X2 n=1 Tax=Latimeria chalumnae TaxID=7897 RepID=UPI00313BC2FF